MPKDKSPKIKLKARERAGSSKAGQLARVTESDKPAPLVVTERPKTPYQELRAARAFALHCDGMSERAIAAELGIARETVRADIHAEAERIGHRDNLDVQRAIQLRRYEDEVARLNAVDCSGDMNPASSAADVAKAKAAILKQIDELTGVRAAQRIQIDQKIQVTEERRVLIATITGNVGATPVLDVFEPTEDQDESGRGSTIPGEPSATSLPSGETEG